MYIRHRTCKVHSTAEIVLKGCASTFPNITAVCTTIGTVSLHMEQVNHGLRSLSRLSYAFKCIYLLIMWKRPLRDLRRWRLVYTFPTDPFSFSLPFCIDTLTVRGTCQSTRAGLKIILLLLLILLFLEFLSLSIL